MSVEKKHLVPGFQCGWYSNEGHLVAEFEVIEVMGGKVARLKVLRSRRSELQGRFENYVVRDMLEWADHIRPGVEMFV